MISKKLCCWNCRGLSSRDTCARIFRLIHQDKLSILCLVETRANSDRISKFCSKLSKSWDWAAILADGFSGGILVCWKKGIGQVTPIATSRRVLHILISSSYFKNTIISVVYNSCRFQSQCSVWYELSKISSLHLPWLIIGDFNSILSPSDHKGGRFYYYSRKALFFRDFIDSNNLFNLNSSGPPFTWCNNQRGLARRWARLDRCLVNLEWSSLFKNCTLKHLSRSCSDHSPLLLSIFANDSRSRNLFRFENFWFDYTDCHSVVFEALRSPVHDSPLHAFSHLLSRTRFKLSNWKSSGLNSVEIALAQTETEINSLEQLDSSTDIQDRLSVLYSKLAAIQRQLSIKWAQRARLLWVSDGDKNTSFFHNSARIRDHHNYISQISDSFGNIYSNHSSIEQAFMTFYTNLWSCPASTDFINILEALPNDLPSITADVGHHLIRMVTKDEIFQALLDLPTGNYCFTSSNQSSKSQSMPSNLPFTMLSADNLNIRRILHLSSLISQLLYNNCEPVIWRFSHAISNINNLLRLKLEDSISSIRRNLEFLGPRCEGVDGAPALEATQDSRVG
ncbi:uncharacterized protein LOC120279156 [Dioscorea cayenensis subsp. rotundata]|uniref:Uncharacterized protein LOC120279156 n=1 Tax=Dioscorea cayennensis subsp. rotundata TaxID=55577 RepID=A0AB40CTW8_DIOCR|nr:uncharacterized protein LOC120279156 [Dioscorea cayenensis subsp. rotundata]